MAHIFTCLSAEQQDFEMSLKESLFLVGVSQLTDNNFDITNYEYWYFVNNIVNDFEQISC